MQNQIFINVVQGETRVAILERNTVAELFIERRSERKVVGDVVVGRVTRVLPGMRAAFVDIGLDKAAFLYVGDYLPATGGNGGEEGRGRRRGRNGGRALQPIDALLSEGREIVVQVAKEPIGTKGARITSYIAIAGRHLVLTPVGQRLGVSRRIDSDRERRRLRNLVDRLRPPDLGFIIRTAGEGARAEDVAADIKYLSSVWEGIGRARSAARAPQVLYQEPSLPLRVVRDLANPDTHRIVVDAESEYREILDFVERFVADPKPKVEYYKEPVALFERYEIEPSIDAGLGRKVWLKSGGHLIIDQSEALTAIDVNTGRYVGKRDLEETVLRTNLEAVKEVVHQLRFRNIGGLIIIDLIDMDVEENREKVYRSLRDAIRGDKAKTNILKISELGLVEMTRKRTRENLVQQLCEPCGYCDGRGYVLSRESVTFKVLRDIRRDLAHFCGRRVAVHVHPRVAELLLGGMREVLRELEVDLGRSIEIEAHANMHQEQCEVVALEEGPPVVLEVPWLSDPTPTSTSTPASDSDPGDGATGESAPDTESSDAETPGNEAEGGEATATTSPVTPRRSVATSARRESTGRRRADAAPPSSPPGVH